MNANLIHQAMTDIDDEFIVEAERYVPAPQKQRPNLLSRLKMHPIRWVSTVVSCLLIICLLPTLYFTVVKTPNDAPTENTPTSPSTPSTPEEQSPSVNGSVLFVGDYAETPQGRVKYLSNDNGIVTLEIDRTEASELNWRLEGLPILDKYPDGNGNTVYETVGGVKLVVSSDIEIGGDSFPASLVVKFNVDGDNNYSPNLTGKFLLTVDYSFIAKACEQTDCYLVSQLGKFALT